MTARNGKILAALAAADGQIAGLVATGTRGEMIELALAIHVKLGLTAKIDEEAGLYGVLVKGEEAANVLLRKAA